LKIFTIAQKQSKRNQKTKSLERKRKAKAMFLSFTFKKNKEISKVTKGTTKFQRSRNKHKDSLNLASYKTH